MKLLHLDVGLLHNKLLLLLLLLLSIGSTLQ